MRKVIFSLMILLSINFLTKCNPSIQHVDPFYNYDDFSHNRIPLINPIDASRLNSHSSWSIELHPAIWIVDTPNSQELYYGYTRVEELEKFAVMDGIIMAFSSYVDKNANADIQNNYYHWFVNIPDIEMTIGFRTENEFLDYIQSMGIEDPDWHTPNEAFKQFRQTGCLEWIPDCKFVD